MQPHTTAARIAPAPAVAVEMTPDEYEAHRAKQLLESASGAGSVILDDTDPDTDYEDTLRAEVAQEDTEPGREYPDGAVAVPLEGKDGRRDIIHVLDIQDWPSTGISDLRVGDFESWASECLALDDYDEIWSELRPTVRTVSAMLTEWKTLTGQDPGKSRTPGRSFRRTARR